MNLKWRLVLLSKASKLLRSCRMKMLHWGGYINVDRDCIIERNVGLDKVNPKGVYIGSGCLIASGTTILAHEHIFANTAYFRANVYQNHAIRTDNF